MMIDMPSANEIIFTKENREKQKWHFEVFEDESLTLKEKMTCFYINEYDDDYEMATILLWEETDEEIVRILSVLKTKGYITQEIWDDIFRVDLNKCCE